MNDGVISPVPSYFIECLAYNVPDALYFAADDWREITTYVCASIYSYAKAPEPGRESDRWVEVNGERFLFFRGRQWTREDARRFAMYVIDLLD